MEASFICGRVRTRGFSEKALDYVLRDPTTAAKVQGGRGPAEALAEGAMLPPPVGFAAQKAAIAAIATLGERNDVFTAPAYQALESIATFKPKLATAYLEKLSGSLAVRRKPVS